MEDLDGGGTPTIEGRRLTRTESEERGWRARKEDGERGRRMARGEAVVLRPSLDVEFSCADLVE